MLGRLTSPHQGARPVMDYCAVVPRGLPLHRFPFDQAVQIGFRQSFRLFLNKAAGRTGPQKVTHLARLYWAGLPIKAGTA